MMDFLRELFNNSQTPILSAVILGLMTAISPCPLATNITAIAFISKNIENKKKVFINGLIYTLGRIFGYTSVAAILVFGASKFHVATFFNKYGERFLGPVLIIIGIFMLGLLNFKFQITGRINSWIEKRNFLKNYTGSFLLGIVFSLAFCPYSGVLFFGMLMPLTISSSFGLAIPAVFAFSTGIPVIIFAWLIAFALSNVGKLYNSIKNFEKYFRKIIAVLFIIVGIYYVYNLLF